MSDDDRAYETFTAEYRKCFPPGGDAQDHDDAVRQAVEAVVEFARQPLVEDLERQQALTVQWADEAERLRVTDWTGAHTCYADCPCHEGGEPAPDFETERLRGDRDALDDA